MDPWYRVWHIAHRCHRKQFLLKFARDRRRYLYWLFEAKKRYGLCALDCMAVRKLDCLICYQCGFSLRSPSKVDGAEKKTSEAPRWLGTARNHP